MQRLTGTSGSRGVVTVEMAIVAPLLIFLLFGIIEFGLMVRDSITVHEAAREGARVAVVGATTSTTTARTTSALTPLDPSVTQIELEYRQWDFSTSSWGAWQTLVDSGGANCALPGDQLRVSVTYPHQIMLLGLFVGWSDDGSSGVRTLYAATIMRRE